MSTHSAIAVADHIIQKAGERQNTLTPMQVIKLVYMCHGWMLGIYHRPLIKEYVEAWQYGPVIPELYQKVKRYRSGPVTDTLSSQQENFKEEEIDIMDQVVNVYGEYSGIALSQLTHAEGTPWHKTWTAGGCTISNDLIEDHYQKLHSSQAD